MDGGHSELSGDPSPARKGGWGARRSPLPDLTRPPPPQPPPRVDVAGEQRNRARGDRSDYTPRPPTRHLVLRSLITFTECLRTKKMLYAVLLLVAICAYQAFLSLLRLAGAPVGFDLRANETDGGEVSARARQLADLILNRTLDSLAGSYGGDQAGGRGIKVF